MTNKPLKTSILYAVMAIAGMWFVNRCSKKHENKNKNGVELTKVKSLSYEWEGLSTELNTLQQEFDEEQVAYNRAVQQLTTQRLSSTEAFSYLSEMKMELNDCLRTPIIDVETFKQLSGECVNAYLDYEREQHTFSEMDEEFNNLYANWEEKSSIKIAKLRELRQRIKDIEVEIKTLCNNV